LVRFPKAILGCTAQRFRDRLMHCLPQALLLAVAVASAGAAGLGALTTDEHPVLTGPVRLGVFAVLAVISTGSLILLARGRMQAEARHASMARFEALVRTSSDIIGITRPDGTVLYASPSLEQILGLSPAALVGASALSLVHADEQEDARARFRAVAAHHGASVLIECRVRHADSSWRHAEIRLTNALDVAAVHGIVLNVRDVTERHSLEEELRHLAFHDQLTGLGNRTFLVNRVEAALANARRNKGTIAVLHCDVESLRRINDGLGFSAGTSALRSVADRLRQSVRGGDAVARLSGHEFGVLLDRLTSPADALLAMERIVAALRAPVSLPNARVEVQPVVGIAVPYGDETAEDVMRNAAVAMNRARAGESNYALFDPKMQADAERRVGVESELRLALERREFELHFQPLVGLGDGRMTGVEALIRWRHPERGLVQPLDFIPAAEESGLIVPMGQWVLREGCRQLREWHAAVPGGRDLALAINLSARQLRHPNMSRDLADALDDFGIEPSRIVLEITESVLMFDTAATLERLAELKALGVRLAVDDFGTGYSSFAYLRRFPIDILKIDKSFIDEVANEATASALVEAMIRIGKTLRLQTVAEGVERRDQADRLRALGCDVAQGFLYSRGVPAGEFPGVARRVAEAAVGPASGAIAPLRRVDAA
jgi:diguanylate cyclase (GGDEF)-like protein/PAS domain S-box-containing protein